MDCTLNFFSSSSCLVWKLTFSVHELENPCSAYDVTGVPTFDARFCAYVEMPNNVSGIKALNSLNWFQIRKNFCGGRWVSAKTPTILQKRLPYWCIWLEVLTEWWKHACDRLHHEYLSWFFAIRKWNLDKQHFCLPLTICPRFGHHPQSIHVAGSSGKTKIYLFRIFRSHETTNFSSFQSSALPSILLIEPNTTIGVWL